MNLRTPEAFLLKIYQSAVKGAGPENLFRGKKIGFPQNPLFLGAGKASHEMLLAYIRKYEIKNPEGCVIVPHGFKKKSSIKGVELLEGDHPFPSRKSVHAAKRLLDIAGSHEKRGIVFLLSGGASSLFELPFTGISLRGIVRMTELLFRSGATIHEINCIRKHLSRVKGGRLVSFLGRRQCLTLILSDVPGNKLEAIGSGPTCPDSTTYQDALEILKRLRLTRKVPQSIFRFLDDGARGLHPETPKCGDSIFTQHRWEIIGDYRNALKSARETGQKMGLKVSVEKKFLTGEARKLGEWFVRKGEKMKGPALLIAGGEPTVTISGKGKGGRCQETALAFLIASQNKKEMVFLAAGTDGIDGLTDSAGAIVSRKSFAAAKKLSLQPEKFLRENDSHTFFRKIGGLIRTGYTGTNVNDLFLLWIPA